MHSIAAGRLADRKPWKQEGWEHGDRKRRLNLEFKILIIGLHLSRAHFISPMMILWNTKKMKMLRRFLLLRLLSECSNTGP
jgi:hypothetical protein